MIMLPKAKVYMDNCCFNRPYDDQTQLRIEIETKAKLHIQRLIINHKLVLITSYILEYENNDNPYIVRKTAINDFFQYAEANVRESQQLLHVALGIMEKGLKPKDSLHLASAIVSECDFFLTTDDRLLKYKDDRINIMNPVDFILLEEVINIE